jgi:hypothetical protein
MSAIEIPFSRQPSILQQLTEHVDVVLYLVARGLQSPIMRPKTPVLYLLVLISNVSSFSSCIRKSSALCLLCSFFTHVFALQWMRGVGYLHFRKGFGIPCVPDEFPSSSKPLLFSVMLV